MFEFKGRNVNLTELTEGSVASLYGLINFDEDYILYVNKNYKRVDFSDFGAVVKNWFENGKINQFLIHDKSGKLIGTIFIYGFELPGSVRFSIFIKREFRNKIFSLEAVLYIFLFVLYDLKLKSVRFSVYKTNEKMNKILEKMNVEIGESKREDLFEYVLDESGMLEVLNKYHRLLPKV